MTWHVQNQKHIEDEIIQNLLYRMSVLCHSRLMMDFKSWVCCERWNSISSAIFRISSMSRTSSSRLKSCSNSSKILFVSLQSVILGQNKINQWNESEEVKKSDWWEKLVKTVMRINVVCGISTTNSSLLLLFLAVGGSLFLLECLSKKKKKKNEWFFSHSSIIMLSTPLEHQTKLTKSHSSCHHIRLNTQWGSWSSMRRSSWRRLISSVGNQTPMCVKLKSFANIYYKIEKIMSDITK